MTAAEQILPGLDYVEGVVKLDDGLVLFTISTPFYPLKKRKL